MKKFICYVMAVVCLLTFGGCSRNVPASQSAIEITSTISRDVKYDSATVALSPEEFENAGFQLGDSCDVEFKNGYAIEDVPFYNGYYVKNNEAVIVAYPGFSYVCITYNNMGIFEVAKLTDGDKVTIRLNQTGKYSAVQDVLGQVYSEEYQQKVATGMKAMLQAKGPIYLHCMEGKDRTGFVSFLLEALAGASYEEMCADYMKTYENYYSISKELSPEKYNAITNLYFDAFAEFLHGTDNKEELTKANYVQDAVNYLIAGGMSEMEVGNLREFITK